NNVDTAPTGHCLKLVTMPQMIKQFLRSRDALAAKYRYMKARFNPSAHEDETDNFLEELGGLVEEMEALLRDPVRCHFVPVTLAEALSVSETCALVRELQNLQVTISDMVVNRLVPPGSCPACADAQWRQKRELKNLFAQLSSNTFWGLPLYPEEVRGRKRLEAFWKGAKKLDVMATALSSRPPALPVRIEEAAQRPWPEKSLLIFAGKGGVGKTTLACATATRLAAESPERKVLLFSADPAHSLSACLDFPVGAMPTSVRPGLWAMEINAQVEFEALKQEYRKELNDFLGSLLPSLDLTFDREVMERILDLSPPGLDEIMALMRIMEFLERDQYDVIVLDTAPTGHLIRLLELPQLVDRWLKVFFGLFLKYKQVFRLPKIAQRLVELSKRIKQFRALLSDSSNSALYAVSILTLMALEETKDLLTACQRMGIFTPVLFLNQATPPFHCPLCSALYQGEQEIRRKFREAFPEKQQTLIFKQGEPSGLKELERLGEFLYAPLAANKLPPIYANALQDENSTQALSIR
ncbi:MAG: TRC40/GET3/ArsA family transport-energizing ATPase, partial [bacterium]|nr:TRC40/GET3/ArsA family transport-energizing ATPase [bacterium]